MRTPPHWDTDHPAVQAWLKQPQPRRRLPFHVRYRGFHTTIGLTSLILAGGFVEQKPDIALGLGFFAIMWASPIIGDIIEGRMWD